MRTMLLLGFGRVKTQIGRRAACVHSAEQRFCEIDKLRIGYCQRRNITTPPLGGVTVYESRRTPRSLCAHRSRA